MARDPRKAGRVRPFFCGRAARGLRSVLTAVLAGVALAASLSRTLARPWRMALVFGSLAAVLWLRRGALWFAWAAGRLSGPLSDAQAPKVARALRRALGAGVGWRKTLASGAVLVQMGDDEAGTAALREVQEGCPDASLVAQARVALAGAAWAAGDLEGAVALVDKVREGAYRDRNFYVSGCAFYLLSGRVEDFRALVDECASVERNLRSPAVQDLLACDAILRGRWRKAEGILSSLLDGRAVDFADPYVHLAQTRLHQGRFSEAAALLQEALETARFARGAIIGREEVQRALEALGADPEALRAAGDRDPLSLVNGRLPSLSS